MLKIRWEGHVAQIEKRKAYVILAGQPEGKRSLEKPRLRLLNNIEMDHREIGWGNMTGVI
jgi:hypothetical protein